MYENLALSDNGFLFDTRTGATYSLSTTGTFLVKTLIETAGKGAPSNDALAAALVDAFDVTDDVARRDVERFMFRLRDMQLVDPAALEARPERHLAAVGGAR